MTRAQEKARASRQLQNLLGAVMERDRRATRERERAPRTSFRRLKAMERALRRAKGGTV